MKFSELQIRLHRDKSGSGFWADFYSRLPGKDSERLLKKDIPVGFDFVELQKAIDNCSAAEYSNLISQMFYERDEIRSIIHLVVAEADAVRTPVRIRIRTTEPEIQNIRWELLQHPDSDTNLLSSGERCLLSRYLDSSEDASIPNPKNKLKILGAVSNPTNMPEALAPIDVQGELKIVKDNIGALSFELTDPPSLNGIIQSLKNNKHDVLYMVCHGFFGSNGIPYLWLENDDKSLVKIGANEFSAKIKELSHRPRLVILVSCKSGGDGNMQNNALAAIGPQLIAAGVSMVLAMQGNISMETAHVFIGKFLYDLRRYNHVDWAVSSARSFVNKRPDFWMPVLYMRSDNGSLWQTSQNEYAEDNELKNLLEEHFSGQHFQSLDGMDDIPLSLIGNVFQETMNSGGIREYESPVSLNDVVFQISEHLSSSVLLLSFFERLALAVAGSKAELGNQIRNWNEQHCDSLHIHINELIKIRDEINAAGQMKEPPCLQIIISPDLTNPNQPRYLIDARDGRKNHRILDRMYRTTLDPGEFSDVFLTAIAPFLDDLSLSERQNLDTQMSELGILDIWVEIFAPLQFLNELIDQWHVKNDFDDFLIGHRFIVVLRAYDRYYGTNKLSLWLRWKERWDYFQSAQNDLGRIFMGDIDQNSIELAGIHTAKIICLGLGCKPKANNTEILKQALRSGAPYILWTRNELNQDDLSRAAEIVLNGNINDIPIRIRDLRKADDVLGNSLGVIWDDGRRTPPKPEQLKSPG